MGSNVVSFGEQVAIRENTKDKDAAAEFVNQHLIPWAIENGINVHADRFLIDGATIMSCIQGMLQNV